MADFKHCPFCGSTNISCADAGYKTDVWFVQCEDCGATFPHFDSEAEAVEAWNRRVEVKHGRWEFRYEGTYFHCRAYCSVCGKHSGIGGIKTNQAKPYCPNCGAKMDLKEGAEE